MPRRPPKKQPGISTGPRRRNSGAVMDVTGFAERYGDTAKGTRAKVARKLVPFRRQHGRIIFLVDEVDAYFRQLPGVTLAQALTNVAQRASGENEAAGSAWERSGPDHRGGDDGREQQ